MKALCFGEILFDCFPSYRRIGGAPFNVASHIVKLGGNASIVSSVGLDELGKEALSLMRESGVDDEYVSYCDHPTGRADITLNENGDADYTFNSPCAWDNINLNEYELGYIADENWDAFIFGTLASRSGRSRESLFRILENIKADHVFFDVNFRKDFYSEDMILKALSYTTILKVNEDELPRILDICRVRTVDELIEAYDLEYVLLTLGGNGSTLYSPGKSIHQDIVPGPVVDTVGAGDSLSAAFLYFLSKGEKEETALAKAGTVASFVVSSEGAVPDYPQALRDSLPI